MSAAEVRPAPSPYLDDLHARLCACAQEWGQAAGLFETWSPQRAQSEALNASTYAHLCAPRSAGIRPREVATTFTLIFFFLDDVEPGVLRELLTGSGRSMPVYDLPAVRAWFSDFPELERCAPANRSAFETSFQIYLEAIRDELDIDPSTITVAQQWHLRRRNAFIDPYFDAWNVALDLRVIDSHCARRLREIAKDLILIANDLGSLARDSVRGGDLADLNLVHTYCREHSIDTDAACNELTALHNDLAREFETRCADLIEADPIAAPDTIGLLRSVVDGNMRAMRALERRYAGSKARLDALSVVR